MSAGPKLVTVGEAIAIIGIISLIGLLFYAIKPSLSRDDTDPGNGRSGLVLLTDAGTGCQYLSRGSSSLTPRLDENGKPFCRQELRREAR